MTNTELSGGDAVLLVQSLRAKVAALEAEKAGRQQAVPSGQHMMPSQFLREYLELLEQSDFKAIHKLVRKNAVEALLEAAPQAEQVSVAKGCTKPGCFPYCDCNSIDSAPAPAERVSQNDWPKCDYCGEVPDCHPWHGSGMFNLVDNPHIHACTDCRHLLPTPAERVEQEPVVWRCPRRDANDDWVYDYSRRKVCDYCEPLFTAPQPSPAPAGVITEYLESARLPCDVRLPPATTIKRGCTLNTLLVGINARSAFPAIEQVFRDKPAPPAPDVSGLVAKADALSEAIVCSLTDRQYKKIAKQFADLQDALASHQNREGE
jgi:hypothetical protein